jgi:hypothetical protein
VIVEVALLNAVVSHYNVPVQIDGWEVAFHFFHFAPDIGHQTARYITLQIDILDIDISLCVSAVLQLFMFLAGNGLAGY